MFAKKDQDLSHTLPLRLATPCTPCTQGCCGEIWEHFILLSLTAGQKTMSSNVYNFILNKHLPKEIIVSCVHTSGVQVSKQPCASSLQNLKFFTGLGRCQQ